MREVLADLPLAALRLPLNTLNALSQAGLRQISHLYPLGRADLTARFGPDMVLRYSQLFGDQPDSQIPVQPVQPVAVTKIWAEPVMGYEALCHMISQLTAEMAERLLDAELAARSFELGWQRTDGQVSCLLFRLSRPGRREQTLQRLMAGAAEKIDAEFGVEYSWIQAHELMVDVPVTALLGTDQDSLQASQVSDMVDILAARLGPDKVQRVVSQSDWHIADSQAYQPVADVTDKTGQWSMPVLTGLTSPRPVRLLDRPEPVKVVAMMPDHPPAMIRWRHYNWTVLRATGPERVGPRWWDPNRTDRLSRDYYRVEVEDGRRLWLCREGLVERGDEVSWFIYGLFS
jgi:protein ImuB